MDQATTATATVLFTDLVGSTEMRARLGEIEADRVFRTHEQQLRELVVANNGNLVKTAGDGIMAAFRSASDAVSAAVAIQQEVSTTTPEMSVRVGVAAGDVSWEGDDCFGLPVVTAARLEAAADPGQILVSAVVRLMAGDRATATYEPLGPLELKGLSSPVDAFRVGWEVVEQRTGWDFPTTLPRPPRRAFVGRGAQTQVLIDSWSEATDGGHPVVLIGGEPGAGKTRIVSEFALTCHDTGALVLSGVCDSDLSLPYQPWISVLDQLIAQLPGSLLLDHKADLRCLAMIAPRAEDWLAGAPRPSTGDPETERHRLFTAMRALLVAAGALAPILVVIDDLHWAGSQTLAMMRFLARSEPVSGVMIVGTFRDSSDQIGEVLAATLADLRRVDAVDRIKLEGLDTAAVLELLSGSALGVKHAESELGDLARQITDRTGGNPFFVWELCLHDDSGRASSVPDSVKEIVTERIRNLPTDERHLAELIAVASNRVELSVLREAAADSVGDIGAGLEGLLRSGMIEELSGPLPMYQCVHALIRDAVVASLTTLAASAHHLAIANALERVHEADRRMVLAELTRHFAAAASVEGGKKAVYYGRRAAAQARRTAAYDEAILVLRVTLEVVAESSPDHAELLVELVDLLQRSGQLKLALAAASDAYETTLRIDDLALRTEAAIGFERAAHIGHLQSARDAAVPMLAEVLGAAQRASGGEPTVLTARARAALARARALTGDPDGANESFIALAEARAVDDPDAISLALEAATITVGDPLAVLEFTEELEEITAGTGDMWRSMWATGSQTRVLIELGRLDEARSVLVRHSERSQAFRFQLFRFQCHVFEAVLALAAGRFEHAEEQITIADDVGYDDDALTNSGIYGLTMFMIRREQGRLDEMRPVLQLLRSSQPRGGVWGPGLALAYAELGMADDARATLDALAPDSFSAVARDRVWPIALGFLADTSILLDDPTHAPYLSAELDAFAARALSAGFSVCSGPADRVRAALDDLLERDDDADRHIAQALDLATASGSPVWEARVEQTWASIQAHRGDSNGHRTHLDRAREIASTVGMAMPDIAPAGRQIRARHDPIPARSLDLPYGLTSREAEVLNLLVAGASNKAIASELFISPNTAANHVRSILQKTASANRTEAAMLGVREGIVETPTNNPAL